MDLEQFFNAGLPEYRTMPFLDFESTDDGWGFRGLGAAYGEVADIGDFTEEFASRAFQAPVARGDNTRLIYDHSPQHVPVLGTVRGRTVKLKDDARGLDVRASIAKHYMGEAARELIKRGDVKGMSPGMIVGRGNSEMTRTASGKPHRVIRTLKYLPEISITPDPAYAGTTAEMRSLWAFQMALLNQPQHILMGAYPQLENRAAPQDTDAETEPAACEACGQDPCVCQQEPAPAETVETVEEGHAEQRSGVTSAEAEAAARSRRLQAMGLTLPPR